jgi:hypothetical protein
MDARDNKKTNEDVSQRMPQFLMGPRAKEEVWK